MGGPDISAGKMLLVVAVPGALTSALNAETLCRLARYGSHRPDVMWYPYGCTCRSSWMCVW